MRRPRGSRTGRPRTPAGWPWPLSSPARPSRRDLGGSGRPSPLHQHRSSWIACGIGCRLPEPRATPKDARGSGQLPLESTAAASGRSMPTIPVWSGSAKATRTRIAHRIPGQTVAAPFGDYSSPARTSASRGRGAVAARARPAEGPAHPLGHARNPSGQAPHPLPRRIA